MSQTSLVPSGQQALLAVRTLAVLKISGQTSDSPGVVETLAHLRRALSRTSRHAPVSLVDAPSS